MTGATCRICGCSPAERCELAHKRQPGRLSFNPGQRMIERTQRVAAITETCHMVAGDICSRCHRPDQITRGQALELERIRIRHDVEVLYIDTNHRLVINVTPRTLDERLRRPRAVYLRP